MPCGVHTSMREWWWLTVLVLSEPVSNDDWLQLMIDFSWPRLIQDLFSLHDNHLTCSVWNFISKYKFKSDQYKVIDTELNEHGNLEYPVTKPGTLESNLPIYSAGDMRYAVIKMILHMKRQKVHQVALDILDAEWKLPLISWLRMMFRWTFWSKIIWSSIVRMTESLPAQFVFGIQSD